jgi:tetrahydromethanopterin S-methyltransferase subunit F
MTNVDHSAFHFAAAGCFTSDRRRVGLQVTGIAGLVLFAVLLVIASGILLAEAG